MLPKPEDHAAIFLLIQGRSTHLSCVDGKTTQVSEILMDFRQQMLEKTFASLSYCQSEEAILRKMGCKSDWYKANSYMSMCVGGEGMGQRLTICFACIRTQIQTPVSAIGSR